MAESLDLMPVENMGMYPRRMWMTHTQLHDLGFRSLGSNCWVDSRALVLEPGGISLGDNVRVDAFSTLSSQGGTIELGHNVHVASGAVVYGAGGVTLASGCGLASGVKILSASDDYVWGNLTNPTMPDELRGVIKAPVRMGEHVVVGANSVILPGSTIGFGAAVGALTLVRGDVDDFQIVSGNPMRVLGRRNRKTLLARHQEFLRHLADKRPE